MSSSTNTASECSPNESPMACSTAPPSSAISEHSPMSGPNDIEAWLTSLRQDSLANHLAQQESKRAPTIPGTSGRQPFAFLGWSSQGSPTWRTFQACLPGLTDISERFCETWPESGFLFVGACYRLPPLAPLISGSGFGLLPTPTAQDASGARNRTAKRNKPESKHNDGTTLTDLVTMFPTPTSREWKSSHASEATMERNARPLNEVVARGLLLNPDWVELLMGWPRGWTSLEPLSSLGEWGDWPDDWEDGTPRTVAKGVVPDRAKRLRAIGNGQVPKCAAEAFQSMVVR